MFGDGIRDASRNKCILNRFRSIWEADILVHVLLLKAGFRKDYRSGPMSWAHRTMKPVKSVSHASPRHGGVTGIGG